MSNHDPTLCRLCESLSVDQYRRHWKHEPKAEAWHVVADGPALMIRLPLQAHFVTVLSYRSDETGDPAHYCGPLYFEFDGGHPPHALDDLPRCMQLLHTEFDAPLDAIHIWHSGGRGFHVTIPPEVVGAEAGHPQLPRIYARIIEQLFPPSIAPTLDRGIYNGGRGRMWRLPNRRRLDTGRYKVRPYGKCSTSRMVCWKR